LLLLLFLIVLFLLVFACYKPIPHPSRVLFQQGAVGNGHCGRLAYRAFPCDFYRGLGVTNQEIKDKNERTQVTDGVSLLASYVTLSHKIGIIVGIIYLTLSHKISLKLHCGYFEMCIIMKTADTADYFGI